MLDFIKKNYQVGATIEIVTSAGVYAGQIEFMSNKYIVLRQNNGKICGIAGSDIFTFQADIPAPILAGEASWEEADGEKNECTADRKSSSPVHTEFQTLTASPIPSAPETLLQTGPETPEKEETAETLPGTISLAEPKVVGQIDLKKLQEIDPKFSRRNYFLRTNDRYSQEHTDEELESPSAETEEDNQDNVKLANRNQPYVSAKGCVTYFNRDYRYGFIHDFSSDADLYFKMHQIAEPMLLDRIRKGTKVVYTIDHNVQGPTANCIHLPHPVNTLMIIAENCLDSHRNYFAREIMEHVLECYPDNRDAQDLLEEAKNPDQNTGEYTSASHSSAPLYNPSLIYSQAKRAYLKKDFAEAEKLYMQAIEANEKPESCVKDLLTLYVFNYKQTEDEEEKENVRAKALQFLESYRHLLVDNMTNLQFLALNFYSPMGEYTKFMELIDRIMETPAISNVISRKVFYSWQKAMALYKLGRADEALELVDSVLEVSPHNRQLQALRNTIVGTEPEESQDAAGETGDEE